MNAMNPMLRNTPTAAERAKMNNSGYGLETIRGMQDQQTQRMRMGAGAPVSAGGVFGNLFQQNSLSFMQDRAAGASGAAPLSLAQRFMPIAAIEQGTSMMPDPTAPMPAGSSGGRMPSRDTREADPFASTYTPTGPEDPFAMPTPRRARRFAEGGPVIGPGGPKDDAVPAKLSHGEYVLPAEVVQFFGIDRLNKMVQKAKEGSKETPMPEMRPDLTGQMMPAFGNGGMMKPHYAEGGPVLLNNPDEQAFGLRRLATNPYGTGFSITPMMEPTPTPSLPNSTPPPDAAAAPMPGMANGTQPAFNLADPLPEPVMRPAPLTMTKKDRLMMPMSAARTARAAPEFEAAFTGLTGMEKRKARAGLLMEDAMFNRNQARADVAQREADARNAANRAIEMEDWKQKQIIGDQFQQAAENRRFGAEAALTAAQRADMIKRQADDRAEQQRLAKEFTPVEGTKYLINGLGNLVSKETGNPVVLQPEEAKKLGLEIIGADSERRFRYAPAKPAETNRRFMDPVTGQTVELKPGEVLPAGSSFKPLQPSAAPATPADVESLRKKYGY